MNIIDYYYQERLTRPGDINEHMETLYHLAKECNSIVECGVKKIVPSWSFVKGLFENGSNSKILTSVDNDQPAELTLLESVCLNNNILFKFIKGNDVLVTLPDCDLLFIDTWHIYGHLKRELELLSPLTKKYIVMHDTSIDGIYGETVRMGYDANQQALEHGYPVEEVLKGLQPAIEEFLDSHSEWILHAKYEHNHGLTILKRL